MELLRRYSNHDDPLEPLVSGLNQINAEPAGTDELAQLPSADGPTPQSRQFRARLTPDDIKTLVGSYLTGSAIRVLPLVDDQERPMPSRSTSTTVRTLDGLQLAATFDIPEGPPRHAVLLVHGAGVTREEGGFFTRIAAGLAEAGVASLRIDLPGHGGSEGRQEGLSLSAVLNSIRSGLGHLRNLVDVPAVSLLAASFSGGTAAYYAAKRPTEIDRLVLINPLIDYKQRFVDEKSAWTNDYISEKAGRQLLEQGYVGHSPTFKLGRPILNEVFWLQPRAVLAEITAPTLIVHGTKDSFISVESSRAADKQLVCEHRLIELEGAQHGVAVHDDPEYADPQTKEWQAFVIRSVAEWVTADS